MSGIFSTFNTANKGLIAQQAALQTTGHNISNANTEGYSRQRIELKADLAYSLGGVGQLGTGVKMDSIVRLVDDYVSKQIRQENGTFERFTAKSQVLDQVEIIFNEPSDTALNFNLGEMFDSWQELSKNPESLNSKTIVVEKAKTLADTLNHMADQLNSLSSDTIGQIEKNVYDFNTIVNQLDSLNKQIFNISVKGEIPNDLMDQRDLMLKNLSSISNFDASFDKYGRVSVEIGNAKILGGSDNLEMSMIDNIADNGDGTFTVTISKGGDSLAAPISYNTTDVSSLKTGQVILNKRSETFSDLSEVVVQPGITSGQITGNLDAVAVISERKTNLDVFAKTMADAINTVHRNGTSGIDFFTDSGSADTLQVNQAILTDNSKVNVGKDSTSSEGDGSRALAIASLRNAKISFSDSPNFASIYDDATMTWTNQAGGITIEGAYSDIVTKVGISKEHADNMVANQGVLLDQLQIRRESTSGVSIDEEVTNLIKFQKSFEANAKVISVLTEMLDTLINRTGV